MSITAAEIASQPDAWSAAAALAADHAGVLPAPGARVCVIGCGTSLYVAQAYAALRERAGQGETDAFPASELPGERRYDVLRTHAWSDEVLAELREAERRGRRRRRPPPRRSRRRWRRM